MSFSLTSIGNFFKANWPAFASVAAAVYTYISPVLKIAVASNPITSIIVGIVSVLAASYLSPAAPVTPKVPVSVIPTPIIPVPVVPAPVPVPVVPVPVVPVPVVPVPVVPGTVVTPIVMPVIPSSGISGYARIAGFTAAALVTIVEIGYAESNGNPLAVGDSGTSIGIWQINIPAHPEYTKQVLLDPQQNANAAFKVYTQAGNSFKPWTTFNTGAYLAQAVRAQADITG
jgi:hypothetical protein